MYILLPLLLFTTYMARLPHHKRTHTHTRSIEKCEKVPFNCRLQSTLNPLPNNRPHHTIKPVPPGPMQIQIQFIDIAADFDDCQFEFLVN